MSAWADFGKEVLKLWERPSFTFPIWLFALIVLCVLILTPPLEDQRYAYGPYVGGVSLLFFLFWSVQVVLTKIDKRETLKQLDSLTRAEAELLLLAVAGRSQTIEVPRLPFQTAGSSLIEKGLLKGLHTTFQANPYIVPRFVWDHINKEHVFMMLEQQTKR